MKQHKTILAAGLIALLAACGGSDGSGIASAPVPVPSPSPTQGAPANPFTLPPTPATTSGTYQTIASIASYDVSSGSFVETAPDKLAPAGAITLAVDAATKTYTLTVNAGAYLMPAGTMTMPATADIGITHNNPISTGDNSPLARIVRGDLVVSTVPAGTDANGALRALTSFITPYNVGQQGGLRYVSMAYWGQFHQVNSTGIASPENFKQTERNSGFLVFGQRTLASELPLTGTANFKLSGLPGDFSFDPNCSEDFGCSPPVAQASLAVDFATRRLDADYSYTSSEAIYDEAGEVQVGSTLATLLLAGSGEIGTAGGFDIALSGNGTINSQRTDGTILSSNTAPQSGSMTGAFFGPRAEEVAGLWSLPFPSSDGTFKPGLFTPFSGQRTGP